MHTYINIVNKSLYKIKINSKIGTYILVIVQFWNLYDPEPFYVNFTERRL